MAIPVIDIFAGPGGLGEGFSSVLDKRKRAFDIQLSIEMDENAHKTLLLRSFFRKFPKGKAPEMYYDVLRETNLSKREQKIEALYTEFADKAAEAKNEAWCAELGGENFPPELVDKRIAQGLKGEKDWVLIGGPPCQAYSLVGRSRRQWKDNVNGDDHRVHLYKEYLRIIAKHHPAVFVMENVRGLLSAKLEGKKMFGAILEDLRNPGRAFPGLSSDRYTIYSLTAQSESELDFGGPAYKKDSDFLVKCEEYGIPQKRHRVILLGVRNDIRTQPGTLDTKPQVTLQEVIGDLPKLRSGIGRSIVSVEQVNGRKKRKYRQEPDTDKFWKKLMSGFREEIVSWNGFAKKYGKSVSKVPKAGTGGEFLACDTPSKENPLYKWYFDERIGGVCNHQSRSHLVEDLKRYMFSGIFTRSHKRFPRLHDIEAHSANLMPDHENARSGKFADRFRVQLPDQPATTVTSHISKDGHYFIHYDPDQCRSLTVREAARLQTFPDNYLFCGSRTAQYHQVGNAVPPYIAEQIGRVLLRIFNDGKHS